MAKKNMPKIDCDLCTACGVCVDVCPVSCLELPEDCAVLARPGDCTSCEACVEDCPAGAIVMEEQDL